MKHLQNIWLLLDSKNTGGIESHVLQLAQGLKNYNQCVTVVFLTDYGNHPLRDALVKNDIDTITLDGKLISLYKSISELKPCAIHTHGYKAGIYGRIAGTLCKTTLASTFHAGEITMGKLGFYCWLDRVSAFLADTIYAVSPQIASRLPERTRVVNNFVDTSKIPAKLDNIKASQIAFVGRLSPEKGPDYFISLAQELSELDFHIYGEGPMENELRLSTPENIHFHGQQNSMQSIWPKIELLVMPSRHEGLPMAALEAMAHGIPVIATRVGALDHLIDSGVNGWLSHPGDIKSMVTYIQNWKNMSNQKKDQIKKAAKATVHQRFSTDSEIPGLIRNYKLITN